MTDAMRESLMKSLEADRRMLHSANETIKFYTELLKDSRKDDRRHLEWVWSRGVLDELEMEIYNVKNYAGSETRRLLKMRASEYRWRNKLKHWIKRYETWLAEE